MRLTYIHAYQSFLWNTVVSKRLSKFGPIPIVGDLVFAPGTSGECEVDAEMEMMNEESIAVEPENDQSGDKEANGDKEADSEKSNAKAQRNQRKVIFIDENNIKDYTINDIILPLPGFDITYPANEVAGWYTELLEADGLTEMDFKQSTKYVLFFCFISFSILYHKLNLFLFYSPFPRFLDRTYNLGGAYRLVMSKPSDVKWKFVRYDDPTLSLIPSDWDRLEKTQPPPAAVKGIIPLAQWTFCCHAISFSCVLLVSTNVSYPSGKGNSWIFLSFFPSKAGNRRGTKTSFKESPHFPVSPSYCVIET